MGVFDQNSLKFNDAKQDLNENGIDIFPCNNFLEDCDYMDMNGNCAFEHCIFKTQLIPRCNPSIKVKCSMCGKVIDANAPFFRRICNECKSHLLRND